MGNRNGSDIDLGIFELYSLFHFNISDHSFGDKNGSDAFLVIVFQRNNGPEEIKSNF